MAMKTFRVCLSSELPSVLERSSDFIYLAYNKLNLYIGQNEVEEDFAIIDAIPEVPVPGMIYILNTDGSVHRNIDYSDVKIAEIEDPAQIEILKKAGTPFFNNIDKRYMDTQTRTLTLPFNDGTYELSVGMKNDQVFNDDTILKYNQDKERFEIFGPSSEEFTDYSKKFRGGKTQSVDVNVDGPRITAQVRVSQILGNLLKKASDGLYINDNKVVPREEFDAWAEDISDFKSYAYDILDRIDSDITKVQGLITEEKINSDIMAILVNKYPDIETALSVYHDIVRMMTELSTEVMSYATTNVNATSKQLIDTMEENSRWVDLDDLSGFTQEVDYYQKAEDYLYHKLTDDEIRLILAAAVGATNVESITIL